MRPHGSCHYQSIFQSQKEVKETFTYCIWENCELQRTSHNIEKSQNCMPSLHFVSFICFCVVLVILLMVPRKTAKMKRARGFCLSKCQRRSSKRSPADSPREVAKGNKRKNRLWTHDKSLGQRENQISRF